MHFPDASSLVFLTFVAAVLGLLGGMGGRWIAMRQLHRRIDIVAEDVDGLAERLNKRQGREAVQVREKLKAKDESELDLLRARAAEEQAKKRGATRAVRGEGDGTPPADMVTRAFAPPRGRESIDIPETGS